MSWYPVKNPLWHTGACAGSAYPGHALPVIGSWLGVVTGFAACSQRLLSAPDYSSQMTLPTQVLPLVAGSMVAGVCALRGSAGAGVGRVARATLAYYTATTAAAVLLGVLLVVVLQPGAACSFKLSLGELTELDACKEWLSCSQVHVLLLASTWISWQTLFTAKWQLVDVRALPVRGWKLRHQPHAYTLTPGLLL